MKTVVGLFKNFGQAEDAMGELASLGLPKQEIGLLASARISSDARPPSPMSLLDLPDLGQVAANGPMLRLLDASRLQKSSEGMRGALEHIGLARSEATQCVDGLRRGGTLEAIVVEDDKEAEAVAIMRRCAGEGSIREGVSEASIREGGGEASIREGAGKAELREVGKAELRDAREHATKEVVIPVIEEELRVGKREYDAGGLRVKTRVASVPVDKTVTLREEHVNVERRVIDRPVAIDDDVFRERSLDLRASAEEPVFSKHARVIEEIHLHKDASERVETIHDTLRHTDVQVSEIPAGSRFNPSRYLDHFKRTYEPERYTFDWVAPAYEFGEQLRYRSSGSDWTQIEPSAKSMWEGKNPGTWERFRAAIKTGWGTAGR